MTAALDQTILERRSIRKFLPAPVPRGLVDEALALAQHAPSNSNIQPWRLVFASGAARDRLKEALFKVADHEAPLPLSPRRSSTTAMSLEQRSMAGRGFRSRTQRGMPLR